VFRSRCCSRVGEQAGTLVSSTEKKPLALFPELGGRGSFFLKLRGIRLAVFVLTAGSTRGRSLGTGVGMALGRVGASAPRASRCFVEIPLADEIFGGALSTALTCGMLNRRGNCTLDCGSGFGGPCSGWEDWPGFTGCSDDGGSEKSDSAHEST